MTKQTVLGRVAQLAEVNIDALVGQAEDPQKMLDQLIRDYTSTIHDAEDAVAGTLGDVRKLEQDHAEDVAAAAEWGGKALTASRKADELRSSGASVEADRFDALARIALSRQMRAEREAGDAEPVISAQSGMVATLKTGLDRMKDRLALLRTRREESVARSRTTHARTRMADAVSSVDVLDPTSDLGRFEDKMRREEARVRGAAELAPSSLDAQFESLDAGEDAPGIEARLAHLKSGTL